MMIIKVTRALSPLDKLSTGWSVRPSWSIPGWRRLIQSLTVALSVLALHLPLALSTPNMSPQAYRASLPQ